MKYITNEDCCRIAEVISKRFNTSLELYAFFVGNVINGDRRDFDKFHSLEFEDNKELTIKLIKSIETEEEFVKLKNVLCKILCKNKKCGHCTIKLNVKQK